MLFPGEIVWNKCTRVLDVVNESITDKAASESKC